jgi:hypothetical protein
MFRRVLDHFFQPHETAGLTSLRNVGEAVVEEVEDEGVVGPMRGMQVLLQVMGQYHPQLLIGQLQWLKKSNVRKAITQIAW